MKKEYGITSLTVRDLENNEFFQLMSESMEEIAAFNKANKVDAIYTTKLGLIACTDLREDNPFSFDLNFFHDYSILHYTAFQITLNQLHHSFILYIPAK